MSKDKKPVKREPPLKINSTLENVIKIGLNYNHKAKHAEREKELPPEEGG